MKIFIVATSSCVTAAHEAVKYIKATIKQPITEDMVGGKFSDQPIRQLYGEHSFMPGDEVFAKLVPGITGRPNRWVLVEVYRHRNKYQALQQVLDMTAALTTKLLRVQRFLDPTEIEVFDRTYNAVRFL